MIEIERIISKEIYGDELFYESMPIALKNEPQTTDISKIAKAIEQYVLKARIEELWWMCPMSPVSEGERFRKRIAELREKLK